MAEVKTWVRGILPALRAIERMKIRVEQKHMDSAMRQGLTIIARAQRSAAPVLGDGNKGLKKAIGSRVGKDKVKWVKQAKAGLGVGKKWAKIKKQDRSGRSGVGISARNAHWFILGAGLSGGRKTKSGRNTGTMLPIANTGFIEQAFESKKSEATKKMRDVLLRKAREEFLKK